MKALKGREADTQRTRELDWTCDHHYSLLHYRQHLWQRLLKPYFESYFDRQTGRCRCLMHLLFLTSVWEQTGSFLRGGPDDMAALEESRTFLRDLE